MNPASNDDAGQQVLCKPRIFQLPTPLLFSRRRKSKPIRAECTLLPYLQA